MIKPKTKVPSLNVNLINGTVWDIAKQEPSEYTLVVFYRGIHCPKCKSQLEEITSHIDDFTALGVNLMAVSMDTKERAVKAGKEWDVASLPIGYGLEEDKAREWGLYMSNAISEKEPGLFSEPGLFLIKPDGTLFFSSIQSMPFARPGTKDIINAIKFIQNKDYPPRGEA